MGTYYLEPYEIIICVGHVYSDISTWLCQHHTIQQILAWVKYRLYSQELFVQQEDSWTPTHVCTHKRHVHTQHTHTHECTNTDTPLMSATITTAIMRQELSIAGTQSNVWLFFTCVGREQGVNRQRGFQRRVCMWLLCSKLHMIGYIGFHQVKGTFQSLPLVLCL